VTSEDPWGDGGNGSPSGVEDAVRILQQAEALVNLRRYREAAEQAHLAAGRLPGDPAPLLIAARAESGLGDHEAAERDARRAVELAPQSSYAHRVLGWVRLSRCSQEASQSRRRSIAASAIPPAREALRLDPHNPASMVLLAEAAAFAGDKALALQSSMDAISAAPLSAEAWMVRSQVLRVAGFLSAAEGAAREALRLDPQHYAANNELGLILSRQGRAADSTRQFEATAALDPVRRSAPANLMRSGRWVSLVVCLLLALPVFYLTPYGLLAGIGLYALVWNVPVTRRRLESWTLAYVRWRARRGGPGDPGSPG
jgi:tetratricopeptide (TPR) repeat protein